MKVIPPWGYSPDQVLPSAPFCYNESLMEFETHRALISSNDTKTAIPPVAASHFSRPALVQQLEDATGVVSVVAPAGYGKSAVVREWAHKTPRWTIGWVTIDEGDRDPARFWSKVWAGLVRVIDVPNGVREDLELPSGMAAPIRLEGLINLIAAQDFDVALVLDDYHRCECPEVDESLSYFLRNQTENLLIVLASRSRPALPLARKAADGELLEIGREDLVFDSTEVRQAISILGLDENATEQIVEDTGGWPVMVGLGAFALRRADDEEARSFNANERQVADYLTEEITRSLSKSDREFVESTSIISELSGPLVNAVTNSQGGGAILERLEAQGFPVQRLDASGEWFTYHQLVAERLRTQLLDERPAGDLAALHLRAARWYQENSLKEEALMHALHAEDLQLASMVFADFWLGTANKGEIVLARTYLRNFPEQALLVDPRLAVAKAWLGIMSGEVDEVRSSLDSATAAPTLPAERFPGATNRLSAISLVESVYYRVLGELSLACDAAETALKIEQAPDAIGRARALSLSGVCTFWRGQFDEAETLLEQAVGTADRFGYHIEKLLALGHLGLIAIERSDTDRATQLATEAESVMVTHRLGRHPSATAAIATNAVVRTSADADEGLAIIERALEIANIQSEPAMLAYLHLTRARLASSVGDDDLDEQSRDIASTQVRRFRDLGFVRARVGGSAAPVRNDQRLTPKELAVMRLLASSLSLAEIGRELYSSHNTVKTHTRNIYRKLGVTRRNDAVRVAAETELL